MSGGRKFGNRWDSSCWKWIDPGDRWVERGHTMQPFSLTLRLESHSESATTPGSLFDLED
jgi:hypothetical protein